MNRIRIAAALYLAIGIVTFGHAANASQHDKDSPDCATASQRLENQQKCFQAPGPNGLGAAIFWPFYWSWEAWS